MNTMNKIFPPLTKAPGRNLGNASQILKFGKRHLSAKFDSNPFDLHMLDSGPSTSTEVTKEEVLSLLKTMEVIRKMEKDVSGLYGKKLVRGFCHLYSGHEAVGTGIHSMLSPKDTVITSYRCHAWMLLMEGTVETVVAEIMGFESGCARGKGGSMHMYAPRLYGGSAIVGSQVPLGTGIALAHKYVNNKGVCVTLFGDGAANQGQVHEAMNIAKLQSLPVLYVAENNTYAMGTSISRHSANPNIYNKSDAVPGVRLDGMDILCVREATKFALDYIRSGKGPLLLEMMTYRFYGHSMSDPGTSYRTRDEVKHVKETKDPIIVLRKKILAGELATEEELKDITRQAKVEVEEEIAKALKGKMMDVKEVAYDIYNIYPKIRMPQYNTSIAHKTTGAFKANKV